MAASFRASPAGLEQIDLARSKKGWNKDSVAWVEAANDLLKASGHSLQVSTLKRFWRSKEPITQRNFAAICKAVGIDDWEKIADLPVPTQPAELEAIAPPTVNWREVCCEMLDPQKALTTNGIIDFDILQLDFPELYLPLKLVERREPERCPSDVQPEDRTLHRIEQNEEPPIAYEQLRDRLLEPDSRRTAIVGEPGAGKTTLLQHLALYLQETEQYFPVWITLGELTVANDKLQSIDDFLQEVWLKRAVTPITEAIRADFNRLLNEGRVWLLLDGVDEVTLQSSTALREIARQMQGWIAQLRVVITCRLHVWEADSNELRRAGFRAYHTKEFSYPNDVHQFITKAFCNKNQESGDRLKADLAAPQHTRLQALVCNPLRLMLLCGIWQPVEKLPSTKAELYRAYVEKFYEWNSERFHTDETKRETLNIALGQLAFKAIDQESSPFRLSHNLVRDRLGDFDAPNSLFGLALKSGWLRPAKASENPLERVYTFFHPTFQEYFAALAVRDWNEFLPKNHIDRPIENYSGKYNYRIFESQWREVILLWLGRSDGEAKEEFVKKLVDFQDGVLEIYSIRAYFFACIAIAECKNELNPVLVEDITKNVLDLALCYVKDYDFTKLSIEQPFFFKQQDYWLMNTAFSALKLSDRSSVMKQLQNLLSAPCDDELYRWTTGLLKSYLRSSEASLHSGQERDDKSPKRDDSWLEQILSRRRVERSNVVNYLIQHCKNTQLDNPSSWGELKILSAISESYPALFTTDNIRTLCSWTLKSRDRAFRNKSFEAVLNIFPSCSEMLQDELIEILLKALSQGRIHDSSVKLCRKLECGELNRKYSILAIKRLKGNITIQAYRKNSHHYEMCSSVILACASQLSYYDFYSAWQDP